MNGRRRSDTKLTDSKKLSIGRNFWSDAASDLMQAVSLPAFLPERSIRFPRPERPDGFPRPSGLFFGPCLATSTRCSNVALTHPPTRRCTCVRAEMPSIQKNIESAGTSRGPCRLTQCRHDVCPLFSLSGNRPVLPRPDYQLRRRSPRRRSSFYLVVAFPSACCVFATRLLSHSGWPASTPNA